MPQISGIVAHGIRDFPDHAGLGYGVEATHAWDLSVATCRASLPQRRSAAPGRRSFAWGWGAERWPRGALEQREQGIRDEAGAGCVHMPVTQPVSPIREKALRQHRVHPSGKLYAVNRDGILLCLASAMG